MANEPRRRMESGAADAHHMSMEGRLARTFALSALHWNRQIMLTKRLDALPLTFAQWLAREAARIGTCYRLI
jgi:hypothetical protein